MKKGNIIFLNGTSSAGKTTLAKALQERLEEPYFVLSCDMFHKSTGEIEMIPAKYRRGEPDIDTAWQVYFNAMSGFHHTIKLFSDMGFNVIVEHFLEKEHKSLECLDVLHGYPVLFVHVTCPVEELRRREKERGDRQPGLSENLLKSLYPQDEPYDITVDTHADSAEECAEKIAKLMDYPEKRTAFETLWAMRGKDRAGE